jgi:hypothetical protein
VEKGRNVHRPESKTARRRRLRRPEVKKGTIYTRKHRANVELDQYTSLATLPRIVDHLVRDAGWLKTKYFDLPSRDYRRKVGDAISEFLLKLAIDHVRLQLEQARKLGNDDLVKELQELLRPYMDRQED